MSREAIESAAEILRGIIKADFERAYEDEEGYSTGVPTGEIREALDLLDAEARHAAGVTDPIQALRKDAYERGLDPDHAEEEFIKDSKRLGVEATADIQVQRGWISVAARLPESEQRVLVTDGVRVEERLFFRVKSNCSWIAANDYFSFGFEVTHWMPMPEPPAATK